ncbi:MAG: hypothetical protein SF066_19525 [Thermoanaerobaculia bacterium]|nr:hypothetical protein [Thermoanaerobaculia bacterium]
MQRTSPRTRPEAAAAPTLHLDRERVAYHLRTADGWSDLQARLQPLGLEVERRGQNLVLTNGGKAETKLAEVARDTSARQLELRLGAFDVWRGQVTEFQERLREATATQLQIRQLDHTWQRTTGLAARLEQRLQVRDSTQLERARLDDRLDGLLTKIYRSGDHRALATPARVHARQALDETSHVLAKLGENQLYGRTLDALTTRTPDRLTKLRDRAHEIAHHRFDLTTEKELGLERIGELARVLGPKGVEAVAEKVARGLPEKVAGRAAGAATGKVAGAGLVAKTSAALSIVKAAVEYVERAGERER